MSASALVTDVRGIEVQNLSASGRKYILAAIQFGLTVAVFALLLRYVSLGEAVRRLVSSDATVLLACLLLSVIQIALLVYRWKAILDSMGAEVPGKLLMRGVLVDRLFSQVLPTAFGGDVVRAAFLIGSGSAASVSILSIAFDRVVGILGLVLLAGLFAPFAAFAYGPSASFALMASVGVVMVLTIVGASLIPKTAVESLAAKIRVAAIADAVVTGHRLFLRRRFYFGGIGLSCAVQLVFCAIFALLALQQVGSSGAFGVALLAPMVLLSGILPLTIGGWGCARAPRSSFSRRWVFP